MKVFRGCIFVIKYFVNCCEKEGIIIYSLNLQVVYTFSCYLN
jgi:hypothetical protein